MSSHLLDNIVWHSISGPHVGYSTGTDRARRYASGFSPIAGFAEVQHPDFDALALFCEPGEHLYCGGWSGAAPMGWQVHVDSQMHQMVWDAATPAADEKLAAIALTSSHVPQMLELVALTHPGPFGPRTRELGEYFGLFEDNRLVAMAGERMEAGAFREISGVCTHPDFQGRGHARRLVLELARRQLDRRLRPFLHVMRDNLSARRLYERLGFRVRQELILRVVSRES
jgi:GNAT superfamily N-acetyltransferase